jgi:hypothetical protein
MKALRLLPAAFAALFVCTASSYADICYVVYDRNDQTVYRDIRPPVDLSKSIGLQVANKWRGGALVIVGNAEKCIPFDIDTAPRTVVARADGATQSAPAAAASATAAKGKASAKAK